MSLFGERHTARRLLPWFVLTTIVPAAALGWLGWTLVKQDRAQIAERRRVAREQALELAATSLQRTLAQLEEQLSTFSLAQSAAAAAIDADAAVATLDRRRLVARAGLRLPFYPAQARSPSAMPDAMTEAQEIEYQGAPLTGAIRLLAPLTQSADPNVRAEALLRTGRLLRKQGRIDDAAETFERLAALDDATVGGQPAGLVALQSRSLMFAAVNRRADLEQAAGALSNAVASGQWPLTRLEFEFLSEQARGWLDRSAVRADDEAIALGEAAQTVWQRWQNSDSLALRRRDTVRVGDRSILVLSRVFSESVTLMLVGPRFLDRHWRQPLASAAGTPIDLALTDADGHMVLGEPGSSLEQRALPPWTVHAVRSITEPAAALSPQAMLMLGGLGLMMAVVAAGGYFVTRAMTRELRVAALQSDFVAAVSHEFRTPLTTVRQLSEMLWKGRVSNEERRDEFYGLLVRETGRLQRLVESLLDYARAESGHVQYRFETVAVKPFLQELVADFQGAPREGHIAIDLAITGELGRVQADRDLLSRVFFNLIDNAVKYSGPAGVVRVEADVTEVDLSVRIRDYGPGIPRDEQAEIFRKFVRGAAAKSASIRGTGIGLAMAREIARGHGGEITVESEPGAGSTFTVVLPLAGDRDRSVRRTEVHERAMEDAVHNRR